MKSLAIVVPVPIPWYVSRGCLVVVVVVVDIAWVRLACKNTLAPPSWVNMSQSQFIHLVWQTAPMLLFSRRASLFLSTQTCCMGPTKETGFSRQHIRILPKRDTYIGKRLTSTCLALHIRQASFRTLPSAGTTAAANSMPNISRMA